MLNVTPDSFSDGGRHASEDDALAYGRQMVAAGADVIDVGGESSRPPGRVYGPGAQPVAAEEEMRRVVGVIRRLVLDHGARISIDTVKPDVASAAIEVGASIVNDVSCGASSELLRVIAERGVDLVLMHTRRGGAVEDETTRYGGIVREVVRELMTAVERAERAGVARGRVWIDPGIGFAKTTPQSVRLLACTAELVATGQRVLVGPSRKSFIADECEACGRERPGPLDREGGTAGAVAAAVMAGAHAVRVHDVRLMRQVVDIAVALRDSAGRGA